MLLERARVKQFQNLYIDSSCTDVECQTPKHKEKRKPRRAETMDEYINYSPQDIMNELNKLFKYVDKMNKARRKKANQKKKKL